MMSWNISQMLLILPTHKDFVFISIMRRIHRDGHDFGKERHEVHESICQNLVTVAECLDFDGRDRTVCANAILSSFALDHVFEWGDQSVAERAASLHDEFGNV